MFVVVLAKVLQCRSREYFRYHTVLERKPLADIEHQIDLWKLHDVHIQKFSRFVRISSAAYIQFGTPEFSGFPFIRTFGASGARMRVFRPAVEETKAANVTVVSVYE